VRIVRLEAEAGRLEPFDRRSAPCDALCFQPEVSKPRDLDLNLGRFAICVYQANHLLHLGAAQRRASLDPSGLPVA
jgi:hypothetical protein